MKTSEFISKLNDPALGKQMSETKSPEEAYAVAKTAGVTDSFEIFIAEIRKLKPSDGELSEDELASVAGGSRADPTLNVKRFNPEFAGMTEQAVRDLILTQTDGEGNYI